LTHSCSEESMLLQYAPMKKSFFLPSPLTRTFLVALVFAAPILTAPLASAFSGGNSNPFGNGSFFPNEGSFQATIRAVNLSGVATFSTGGSSSSSNSTSSNGTSSGSFTVTYQGSSYTGNVDASMDSAGGTIAATLEASVSRGGNGTVSNVLSSSYQLSGNSTDTTVYGGTAIITLPDQVTTVDDGAGNITTTTISGQTQTINLPSTVVSTPGYEWVDQVATSEYMDTLYAAGSFTAKLGNSFPNQIFKGSGSIAFTSINFSISPPALVTTNVEVSVKGSRTSNTAQSFTSTTAEAPFVLTTTSPQTRTN